MNSLLCSLSNLFGCAVSYCSNIGTILVNRCHFVPVPSRLIYHRSIFMVTVDPMSMIVLDLRKIHHFIGIQQVTHSV